jgi:hypothetical protein
MTIVEITGGMLRAGRAPVGLSQDIAASTPPLPYADYLAVTKAQD